jgi:peptidoglycan/xylan/chitin deacetylase (PgdA/CDA1 family)
MKRWHVPVALSATLVLALEVPSFLGAPAVESTGGHQTSATLAIDETAAAELVIVEITYQDIVSEVLSEPEALDDTWVNCSLTPCVALTFDDGPGPYTPDIVEILNQYGARATFYPVGQQLLSWPHMLPLVSEAGHDIGNHTMSHPKLSTLSVSQQRAEIVELDTLVIEQTGFLPTSVRPPFGDLPERDLPDPHSRPVVLWSVDSLDWRKRNSQAIIDEVFTDIGAGDIILMHELYQRSVDALPEILETLAERGLTVVSVPELLGADIYQTGIVKNVPFVCPVGDANPDIPLWCVENPTWQR